MKSVLFVVTFFFLTLNIISQSSFSYLVSTPSDERIFDSAEDELGNYYMVGRKVTSNPNSESAYLLVLNSGGQLVYEHEFYIEDTSSYFGCIYYKNDSIIIFGAKGSTSIGLINELWMLTLDDDFNILKSETYYLDGYNIVDIESIINHQENYVICGMVDMPQLDPDIFFYEISGSGDIVNHKIVTIEYQQFEYDLIEKYNGDYNVFAYGIFPNAPQTLGKIVIFDSSFNYISADSVPYQLYFNHSAIWLNDSSYIVTGNKQFHNPARTDIGIMKLTAVNDFIIGTHFGKTGDTNSYVGACSNLDFISPENIFFGGASNIVPPAFFQTEDSWIVLNDLNSNLQINWQKFYGGDAAYYLWALKATQDGGCLMMATRYDETIQVNELDVFILKVDSNGLLTTVGDGPVIPVQQLAIFPNPGRDVITIRYPDIFGHDNKEIIIFNSLGNEVKRVSATQNHTETIVNVSALPAGLYFTVLKVEGNRVATGKFLVVR